MMRILTIVAVAASLTFCSSAWAQEGQRPRQGRPGRGAPGVRLAIQLYTFNKLTFTEAVDKAKDLNVRFVEGFAWHKISPDTGDAQLNHKAPAEAITKAQKKLEDAGIRLVSYYVSNFGKDEAEAAKVFEFAKKMGIEFFVAEPKADQLKMLDKLAQEHGVKIAIHNHPKKAGDDEYKNWDPAGVMKMIEPYSKAIGVCADTGHWIRSGLDPVESLKKCEGRLIGLHLKDVHEKGAAGHDVPFGTGVGNFKAQLEELKRQNFRGVVAIEYEHNMGNNTEDVRQCAQAFRRTAREIGLLAPRRAGAGEGAGREGGARQGNRENRGRNRPNQ